MEVREEFPVGEFLPVPLRPLDRERGLPHSRGAVDDRQHRAAPLPGLVVEGVEEVEFPCPPGEVAGALG
jgi:hypothetical protein